MFSKLTAFNNTTARIQTFAHSPPGTNNLVMTLIVLLLLILQLETGHFSMVLLIMFQSLPMLHASCVILENWLPMHL